MGGLVHHHCAGPGIFSRDLLDEKEESLSACLMRALNASLEGNQSF